MADLDLPLAADQVLLARQPIFDEQLQVVAHELLFRGDFEAVGGSQASATVLLNAFDQGLLRSGPDTVPAFVNFTESMLYDLPPFEPGAVVIELLEDILPTPEVVAQVRQLKALGYTVALDDYVDTQAMSALLAVVDIVKVDVLDTPEAALAPLVARLRAFDLILLAEKVEDHAQFERCRQLGFQWYQGFFFARPEAVQGQSAALNRQAVLPMIAALQDEDLDPQALAQIISKDSGLTYKVLRLANSAALQRAMPIDTVAHAISMLGLRRLQNFATLVALSNLGHKPQALEAYAAFRANLCERLGRVCDTDISGDVFYTAGVLSCCDAYFDAALETLLPTLSLSDQMRGALLQNSGTVGTVLAAAALLQEGRWDQVDWDALATCGLSAEAVNDAVWATVAWAEDAPWLEAG